MPGKERSKEDTWGEKELQKYVKSKGGSRSTRDEHSKAKESSSSSKKPAAEHQSSSVKHRSSSSSKGAEATTSTVHKPDASKDSKSRKPPTSSATQKGDERHRSKETDRDKKSSSHQKKPEESSSSRRSSSKPPRAEEAKTSNSSSKTASKTASHSKDKDKKPEKTSSKPKERSSKSHGKSGATKQKIKVSENPPQKVVAASASVPSEETLTDTHSQVAVQPMIEVTKAEDDDGDIAEEYNYDQEEFDDYEDEDFDSVSSSSSSHSFKSPPAPSETDRLDLMQVLQAIEAENQQLVVSEETTPSALLQASPDTTTGSPAHKSDESATPSVSSTKLHTSRSIVNFVAAKQQAISKKAAAKTKKRGEELLRLIELDIVVFNILDMPPLSEYELYMRNFGSEDTRQVSCQTGEDSTAREAQTDGITTMDRWVQWPPEDLKGWGCDNKDDDDDITTSNDVTNNLLSDKDAMGLTRFLQSASQVMCVLLAENIQQFGAKDQQVNITEQLSFSAGCVRVPSTQSFLAGRHANSLHFSQSHGNLLLTGFTSHPKTKAQHEGGLQSKGIVCVWNTGDLSQPLNVLISEPHPSCCCFSPLKASLVFAGSDDGSVVLWDLREPVSMHTHQVIQQSAKYSWTPRVPTFITAGLSSYHSVPICSISPLSVQEDQLRYSSKSPVTEDNQGLSFQVATLDHSGRLNIWVIVEVNNPDPSGSEGDLGLAPGGRVKLVRTATVLASSFLPRSSTIDDRDVLFTAMAFHPHNANHCYIGCDEGAVLHTIRYGKRSIPSQYTSELGNITKVTSISFSPWQTDHFLVGCLDGSIRLHHIHREKPLLCWTQSTQGAAVQWLHWSNHRPAVFMVVDDTSRLWVWDLLTFDSGPVMESNVCGGMTGSKSTLMYCSLSHNATGWKPRLVISYSDGSCEIHYLNQYLSKQQENEEQRFADLLNSIIY
ncbi:cytoplasmic dynein 2 intermediate chain 1-like isoform X2 [Dysidea avara]|uniref:cytoplasmic dynein 2 intermediate chain 1-like isoform X2 n=1 Tax=Dysidea avara TaxID=196820 RepID=UPI00331E3ED8